MKNLFKLVSVFLTISFFVSCNDDDNDTIPPLAPRGLEAATISGGPYNFIVGDKVVDTIDIKKNPISIEGGSAATFTWIITDEDNTIVGLPDSYNDVNFDIAGDGICLIWYLASNGTVANLEVGKNTSELSGLIKLSNSVEVNRTYNPEVSTFGGVLTQSKDSIGFTVFDDEPDFLEDDDIMISKEPFGEETGWVVTDADGRILALPDDPTMVDFNNAPIGTCIVWHVATRGEVEGLEVGNIASDTAVVKGNFSLSNPIEIFRVAGENTANGGTLTVNDDPISFIVGDGEDDTIDDDKITLEGNVGAESQWVVTDDNGLILALPDNIFEFNFEGAAPGTCLIWNLSFYGDIEGAEIGGFANEISGRFALSNSIEVERRIRNIFELAAADVTPNLSMLEEALSRDDFSTDFEDVLTGSGPFTLFAPTNAAFNDLIAELDDVNNLSEIPTSLLEQVLLYHVIEGEAYASDNLPTSATMLNEGRVAINKGNGTITDARGRVSSFTSTDIAASNGVVHLISKVLLP